MRYNEIISGKHEDNLHVSAIGKLMPSEVWRIDRRKTSDLKTDGSNFFEVAKKVWPK